MTHLVKAAYTFKQNSIVLTLTPDMSVNIYIIFRNGFKRHLQFMLLIVAI